MIARVTSLGGVTDRWLFVVNPVAGKGRCRGRWERLAEHLRARAAVPFDVHYTSRPGEAEDVVREAVAAGYSVIVGVGGDGTFHELVNGAVGTDAVFGIVPFGTGNDLARALGIRSSEDALLDLLLKPRTVSFNTLSINGRCFVVAAGIGFDGMVARDINERSHMKRMGTLGYLLTTLRVMLRYRPLQMRVRLDGQVMELRDVWFVAIGNCPYLAGGMHMFPGARYDDDQFDVCIVSNLSKLQFLRLFPLVYTGRHVGHTRHVTMLRGRDLRVECPPDVYGHMDGELIPASNLHVQVHPRRLSVLSPQGQPLSAGGVIHA
ncbi:MAG: diacylglycerol kinase family lipid kinase [Alicyclobacillaceae bacterium]|nr:diacylglycerol kinase family lipid kinase [Alicyclobacillaceae bacterium]